MNDFDKISGYYEPLKMMVFGRRLDRAASCLLHNIRKGDRILIIGGGTGRILRHFPENVEITYVERSRRMIKQARRFQYHNIQYHWSDFLEYETDEVFDWIICPFFLDVFDHEDLRKAIQKFCSFAPNGKIIVTDFQKGNRFQNLFLSFMYWFFKITTNIQAKQLLNIHRFMLEQGLKAGESKFFMNGLIFSRIYAWNNTPPLSN